MRKTKKPRQSSHVRNGLSKSPKPVSAAAPNPAAAPTTFDNRLPAIKQSNPTESAEPATAEPEQATSF